MTCKSRKGEIELEIEFLTGKDVERAIERLAAEYNELHWAVAWGTSTPLAQKLLSDSTKIRAVTFGLAFAQTDPDLVDSLIGVDGCYVVTKFPTGTFHPKVYAFRSGKRAAAIIGSANFTRGGLGKKHKARNHEACVLVRGAASNKMLADTLAFTAESASIGERVTEELAARYRLGCKLAARKLGPPHDPLAAVPAASVRGLSSPIASMDWDQYVRAVRRSTYHDVDASLDLLRTAQGWLSVVPSFHDLSTPQRKAIAGIIGVQERAGDESLDRDWGWFGSMGGAGYFKNRVAENDQFLARAIDSIPQKGEVTKDHFNRFARHFVGAFANSSKVGGVATASRLLAMKRPDVFLCISSPNIMAAANEMGFAKSTLNLENYWDRVVEVIRASEWYNVEKPETSDGQLWECRAAMLDTILYHPG